MAVIKYSIVSAPLGSPGVSHSGKQTVQTHAASIFELFIRCRLTEKMRAAGGKYFEDLTFKV